MNSKPRILIFSQLFEPSVDKVASHLERKGASWARINTDTYPIGMTGHWSSASSSGNGVTLTTGDNDYDLSDVGSVWFRRAPHAILPKTYSASTRNFVETESSAFFHGLFSELAGSFWMNGIWAERAASNKMFQLRQAQAVGLRIPKTLVSNAPQQVRRFVETVDGPVIFKPLSGFSSKKHTYPPAVSRHFSRKYSIDIEEDQEEENDIVFARLVDSYVIDNIESVKLSPVIFQEYIDKKSDIRITAFGNVFFACEILSQEHEETRIDFRRMTISDKGFPPHVQASVPEEIEAKVKHLLKILNLEFGCIDLVRTAEDDYVFLEVNPAGQWLWMESLLDTPISEYLADYLMEKAHSALVA